MPLSEYAGLRDEEFLPPETARHFRENDERVLAEGKSLQTIELLRQAGGIEHHYLVSKFPVPGPDGRAAYVAGIALDITERVRAEEVLRFSEARFRALHDANPAMILTIDAGGTIISTNPACTDHLGYTADELEGQPILKIFHEDDRPAMAEQLQMCKQNPDQVYRCQFRKIRKDGGLLWVEELARAVYDLSGALNVLVVCQDFTERKRAEEALQKSEKKFTKIFHEVPALIAISTLKEERFVDVNDATLCTLGYRRDEMIGRTPLELNLWENLADRAAIVQALEEKGSARNIEVRLRAKNGHTLVGLFSADYIEFNGDRYMLSLVRDITDRKRAEEELRKSEQKFAKVFHEVPALVCISTLKEGRFIDVNETMLRMLGYRRDEMIGHTSLELNLWEDLSDRTAILQTLEEKGSAKNIEARFRGKSGQTFVGLFSAEYIDLDDERYMLSLVKDLTLKRQAQEEIERLNTQLAARADELEAANRLLADDLETMKILQKLGMLFLQEENLEQVLSQVLDAAIAISGADFGNIQIMDPESSCLQIAVQRGFPQWWLDFWNSVVKGKGVCGTALGSGERVIVEDIEQSPVFAGTDALEIQRKAGVRAVQSTPLVSRAGTLLGMFSTHYKTPHRPTDRELRLLDLLARHAADFIEEAQLREMLEARALELESANRELEAFNYSVAHDLRRPLTTINGYCQMILDMCGNELGEQCMEYLRETYDSTLRMNQLIGTLLNFSRLAHVELHREPFDLSALAHEIAAELEKAEPARRVSFRIAEGIQVDGDAKLVRVVLDNLLGNAWKYTAMREEAVIEFGMVDFDGKPACFVRDNGSGFAMVDAERLFIPFERLPGSGEFKGHGIGLATVERIILRHGGRIWAEGEPGKGATFYFTL
jgi:PAS domain S-box-containing protein